MKVLFVSHVSGLYGAGRSLLDMLGPLRERGVDPVVVCPGSGPLQEALEAEGIPLATFPLRPWKAEDWTVVKAVLRTAFHVPEALFLALKAQEWSADLIYSNSSVIPAGAMAAKMLGLPHVWHIREFVTVHYGAKFDLGRDWTRRLINRLSDQVIAISEAIRLAYEPFVEPGKLDKVYDGIRTDAPGRDPRGIQGSFPRNDPPVVTIAGLLHPAKGQLEALRAVEILAKQGQEVKLEIVGSGDGAYEAEIRKFIETRGLGDAVDLNGFVLEVTPFLRDSDAVVVCSRAEALGRVTIEALMAGTPVIGAETGATKEILDHGHTGLLYEHGDPVDLAEKLNELVSKPGLAERLAIAGNEMALETFDPEVCADRIAGILHRLDQGGRAP